MRWVNLSGHCVRTAPPARRVRSSVPTDAGHPYRLGSERWCNARMRILLTTRGSAGHVLPLAPFGHACRRAGHDVLVAAQRQNTATAERSGLAFAPFDDPPADEWMPLMAQLAKLDLETANDLMVGEFFARIDTAAALPGLRAIIEDWRPTSSFARAMSTRRRCSPSSTRSRRCASRSRSGRSRSARSSSPRRRSMPPAPASDSRPTPPAIGCGMRRASRWSPSRSTTRSPRRRRGRIASRRMRLRPRRR